MKLMDNLFKKAGKVASDEAIRNIKEQAVDILPYALGIGTFVIGLLATHSVFSDSNSKALNECKCRITYTEEYWN